MINEIPKTIEYDFEWIGEHGRGIDKSIHVRTFIDIEQETHKILYEVYYKKTLSVSTQDVHKAISEYNFL